MSKVNKNAKKSSIPAGNIGPKGGVSIKLSSYEHKGLDLTVREILNLAIREGAKVSGPIPLPTLTKKYVLQSSPHIYKSARKLFKESKHVRLIKILDVNTNLLTSFSQVEVPVGVSITIKC